MVDKYLQPLVKLLSGRVDRKNWFGLSRADAVFFSADFCLCECWRVLERAVCISSSIQTKGGTVNLQLPTQIISCEFVQMAYHEMAVNFSSIVYSAVRGTWFVMVITTECSLSTAFKFPPSFLYLPAHTLYLLACLPMLAEILASSSSCHRYITIFSFPALL